MMIKKHNYRRIEKTPFFEVDLKLKERDRSCEQKLVRYMFFNCHFYANNRLSYRTRFWIKHVDSYRTSTLLQLIYVSWSSTVNEIEEKPDTSLFQTRSGTDLFEPTHQLIKFYCLLSTHPWAAMFAHQYWLLQQSNWRNSHGLDYS